VCHCLVQAVPGQPKPADAEPDGQRYTFKRGRPRPTLRLTADYYLRVRRWAMRQTATGKRVATASIKKLDGSGTAAIDELKV
jgi:hypothetical protein